MWGYTDRITSKTFNPEFSKLWNSRNYQWPLECDFHDMTPHELQKLQLLSIEPWAEEAEESVIQGFTFTL